MVTERKPVTDVKTDYDIFDPEYIKNPFPIWDELRGELPGGAYRAMGWFVDAHEVCGPVQDSAGFPALLFPRRPCGAD